MLYHLTCWQRLGSHYGLSGGEWVGGEMTMKVGWEERVSWGEE